MDDDGLLHLVTRMPQLLHLDVSGCNRITRWYEAREAAKRCAAQRSLLTRHREPDFVLWSRGTLIKHLGDESDDVDPLFG